MAPDLTNSAVVASAVFGAISAGDSISNYRRRRQVDFTENVLDISRLDGAAILAVLERDELVSEVVERGLEGAVRSSAEKKRWLYARVVASALTGDGLAEPDQYPFLVKTVDAIEPLHVQVLVTLATPTAGEGALAGTKEEGALSEDDVHQRLPLVGVMLRPALATLEREGLARNVGSSTWDTVGDYVFAISEYGRLFLRFLPLEELALNQFDRAEVTARVDHQPVPMVVIRNLGPGMANDIRFNDPLNEITAFPTLLTIGPGEEQTVESFPFTIPDILSRDLELRWNDESGSRSRIVTLVQQQANPGARPSRQGE